MEITLELFNQSTRDPESLFVPCICFRVHNYEEYFREYNLIFNIQRDVALNFLEQVNYRILLPWNQL
jgi:hypothetical protein